MHVCVCACMRTLSSMSFNFTIYHFRKLKQARTAKEDGLRARISEVNIGECA